MGNKEDKKILEEALELNEEIKNKQSKLLNLIKKIQKTDVDMKKSIEGWDSKISILREQYKSKRKEYEDALETYNVQRVERAIERAKKGEK